MGCRAAHEGYQYVDRPLRLSFGGPDFRQWELLPFAASILQDRHDGGPFHPPSHLLSLARYADYMPPGARSARQLNIRYPIMGTNSLCP